jgi:hypothetical protein
MAMVIFILNCTNSPCLSREAKVGRRDTGGSGHGVSMNACVGFSFSCLCCNILFPQKQINIEVHVSSKWSFATKKNVALTLQDLEIMPP